MTCLHFAANNRRWMRGRTMKFFSFFSKKRGPVMTLILLAGVSFAGMVSAFIETPQAEAHFLHEHLKIGQLQAKLNWTTSDFDLPGQDKAKISKIISQTEHPFSTEGLRDVLTGQALDEVKSNICSLGKEVCNFPIRVNRQLSADHLNKDMRVVNVQETSRRVNLELKADMTSMDLRGLTDETRVLSFYQTQTGWVQNMSISVETAALSFGSREGQFRDWFAKTFVGLNYYPASASWTSFWKKFPRAEIEADLEKAKALNVNSLRIFLTHDYFDAADTREDAMTKLVAFLDMCEAKGLVVLVTLFDLRPDYQFSNWDTDTAHIDTVLSRVASHDALLGIDIKNQADLDFEFWGQGRIEAWLTVMARHIQTHYPHLPVTTGWSKAENATRLTDVFDFVTYHEYENPKGFETRLRGVIHAAGDKPVMITELGSTIWHPPFIIGMREKKQAARLDSQLRQASLADGVFVWTLNDFEHVSSGVVGPLPWRRAQQKHFGLIRKDGTLRPAADILTSFGERSQKQTEQSTFDSNIIQHSPL